MFVLSILAIVPLAAFLSHATEGIAAKTGDTVGGLTQRNTGQSYRTGNILAALRQGMIELVKASIAGAL
jgi:Ca2+:H+ antiporter